MDIHRAIAAAAANTDPNTPRPLELEGEVDLLLRKLSSEVTSSRRRRAEVDDDYDDTEEIYDEEMGGGGDGLETGSMLEKVRGFNKFLERAERIIREANARKVVQ